MRQSCLSGCRQLEGSGAVAQPVIPRPLLRSLALLFITVDPVGIALQARTPNRRCPSGDPAPQIAEPQVRRVADEAQDLRLSDWPSEYVAQHDDPEEQDAYPPGMVADHSLGDCGRQRSNVRRVERSLCANSLGQMRKGTPIKAARTSAPTTPPRGGRKLEHRMLSASPQNGHLGCCIAVTDPFAAEHTPALA